MRIIPAIDIMDGKCVRLTKGDYTTKKIYNQNPIEVAKEFEANGIEYLHVVDLDGAKSKEIINYKTLESIANQTNLKIDFGGGVKSRKDLNIAFDSGANQVTLGSIAISNPNLVLQWIKMFGSEKIILGADCLNRKIATQGWLKTSTIDIIDFIKKYQENGVENCICTDISKDGMLEGPSLNLYKEIKEKTNIKLIASGGIACIEDLIRLKELGCFGTIVGKAIYENKITLKEIGKLC